MELVQNFPLTPKHLTTDEQYKPRKVKTVSRERILYLWKRVRHVAASIGRLSKMSKDIQLYGAEKTSYTRREKKDMYTDVQEAHTPRWILGPKTAFRKYWSLMIVILLLYTATMTPYLTAFVDEEDSILQVIGYIVDSLFFADIIVNFFSSYADSEEIQVMSHCRIVKHYLKTWFFLDLLACIPFQLIETNDAESDDSAYNKLLRLMRLPRLYRVIRVLRLLKLLRVMKSTTFIEKLINKLKANIGILRLIKFSFTIILLVHIVGCFWYLLAKLEDFHPGTWVTRYGYTNSDNITIYITSIYWVFTTLTTVGYGDISPFTVGERIFAIVLMAFGVGFYSYTISNLSTIMANLDTNTSKLKSKLSALNEFAKATKLPEELKRKIKSHIMLNHEQNIFSWFDQDALMNELPSSLRTRVSMYMHHKLVAKIYFLQDKNPEFIAYIVPKLRAVYVNGGDFVYKEHEYSDEVYFLTKGRVNLLVKTGAVFKSYVKGSYFGEVDILENRTRDCSVQVSREGAELLVLTKFNFLKLLDEFPKIAEELVETAQLRDIKNTEGKSHIDTLIVKKTLELDPQPFRSQTKKTTVIHTTTVQKRRTQVLHTEKEKNRKMWQVLIEEQKEPRKKKNTQHTQEAAESPRTHGDFNGPTFSLGHSGSKLGIVQKAIENHPTDRWNYLRTKKADIIRISEAKYNQTAPENNPKRSGWFPEEAEISSPQNTEGNANSENSGLLLLKTLKSHLDSHNFTLELKVNSINKALGALEERNEIVTSQIEYLVYSSKELKV